MGFVLLSLFLTLFPPQTTLGPCLPNQIPVISTKKKQTATVDRRSLISLPAQINGIPFVIKEKVRKMIIAQSAGPMWSRCYLFRESNVTHLHKTTFHTLDACLSGRPY